MLIGQKVFEPFSCWLEVVDEHELDELLVVDLPVLVRVDLGQDLETRTHYLGTHLWTILYIPSVCASKANLLGLTLHS